MEYAIHLFNAGGVVMYPLVLFMLAACTILFERIRMYRRIDSEIQQLSSSIEAGRNANDWIALEQAIKNNDDALSQFVTPIVDSVYNFEGLENRLHDVVGYMDDGYYGSITRSIGYCSRYDSLIRCCWWRYRCPYCYYWWCIRSVDCNGNRAFSSHRSISYP